MPFQVEFVNNKIDYSIGGKIDYPNKKIYFEENFFDEKELEKKIFNFLEKKTTIDEDAFAISQEAIDDLEEAHKSCKEMYQTNMETNWEK